MVGVPKPGPVKNVNFPEIPRRQLANGMTVLCVEDHHLPKVAVQLALRVGRVNDPAHRLGSAQFVAEMLKEGTAARTSREIAEALDRMAIAFDAEASMEHSMISMSHLATEVTSAMELFAEVVLRPSFPAEEFEKVRMRWLSYLLSQRSDPGFLAGERLSVEMYEGHPYAKISVTPDDLKSIQAPDLAEFHARHYSPRGSFLAFSGAITLEQAVALAETYFGEWDGGETSPVVYPALSPLKRKVVLVHRPNSTQTGLLIGMRGLKKTDPALAQLKMMNQVYGGGSSSRLFLNLREDKGYTYGAYSSIRSYREEGSLRSSASVRIDKTREAIDEVFHEMSAMTETHPSGQELARSRAELIGSFVRRMETPGSIASLELSRLLAELPASYYADYIPSLESVSDQRVVESARRFLDPERSVIVVVSDRNIVEERLAGLGPLAVYDADGNPLG